MKQDLEQDDSKSVHSAKRCNEYVVAEKQEGGMGGVKTNCSSQEVTSSIV